MSVSVCNLAFFFFNDTATTEIYTLSLHDALPISPGSLLASARPLHVQGLCGPPGADAVHEGGAAVPGLGHQDRKSTRLNSSHSQISYAVFCLKKKSIRRFRTDTVTGCGGSSH